MGYPVAALGGQEARCAHGAPDWMRRVVLCGHAHVDELQRELVFGAFGGPLHKQDVLRLEVSVKVPAAVRRATSTKGEEGVQRRKNPGGAHAYISLSYNACVAQISKEEPRVRGVFVSPLVHKLDGAGDLPEELRGLLLLVELDALQVVQELASLEHLQNHDELVVVLIRVLLPRVSQQGGAQFLVNSPCFGGTRAGVHGEKRKRQHWKGGRGRAFRSIMLG